MTNPPEPACAIIPEIAKEPNNKAVMIPRRTLVSNKYEIPTLIITRVNSVILFLVLGIKNFQNPFLLVYFIICWIMFSVCDIR